MYHDEDRFDFDGVDDLDDDGRSDADIDAEIQASIVTALAEQDAAAADEAHYAACLADGTYGTHNLYI